MNIFKEYRIKKGLTLVDVASKICYSHFIIEAIENDKIDFLSKPYNYYCVKTYAIFLTIMFYSFTIFSQDVKDYANTITIKELKEKLYTYSSDEFEGRETGKKGQKIAVNFLKDHYISENIQSLIKGTYFQNVPLKSIKEPEINLKINNIEFIKNEDFILLSANCFAADSK